MRRPRPFLPASVRGMLETLAESDRLDIETHLENLATLASGPDVHAAFAGFPTENERLVTLIGGRYRAIFTVDPTTRLVFVHRLQPVAIAPPRPVLGS